MTSMTFFGFLNEDGSVTRVITKNEIVLPIGVPTWGQDGLPNKVEFTKLTKVMLEKSALSGRDFDELTIVGLYEYLLILVDPNGLCYSVDYCDDSTISK